MLTLYHAWSSTCSQKVRLCLAEKRLTAREHVLDLRRFDQVSPAFLAINPDGMVPVLRHEGLTLTESTVINEYLDDRFPDVPLRPADAAGRARVGMWSRLVDEVASPAIKAPSFARNLAPMLRAMPAEALEAALARMPDAMVAGRWRRAARDGFPPEELAHAHARLRMVLGRMEAALADGPWLAGDALTLADLNMAPFILRLDGFPDYDLARDWPRCRAWLDALVARPSYASARIVPQAPRPA